MNYINKLEIENKGLEATIKELKEENRKLERGKNILKNCDLAMARGARDYNEKLLFAEQRKNKEIENKLTEAEKQVQLLKKTINTLTKENEKLKKEVNQSNQQTVITNADFQELIVNGLNFLTKAMQYNAQKI